MKRSVMIAAGLLVGLASAEVRAACTEGTFGSCKMWSGCPGMKECLGTQGWGPCEPVGGSRTCSVCNGTGTQQCDGSGEPVGPCTRAEQCNSCDDDQDGQVDEGLPGCGGVTCGHVFEQCGDGLDNDCDGAVDEGCNLCTSGWPVSVPFVFTSLAEMRQDTDQPASGGPVYGRRMDSDWRFIPSHRMSSFALRFDQFALESNYDFFRINSTSYTGSPALPFTTGTFNASNGAQATFNLSTDVSVQTTGVRTSHVVATCNNGGGNAFSWMSLNSGADGVLLHQDDNAYVVFTLPPGREVFISVDHDFGGVADFNLFVTWGQSLFGTSCASSNLCGTSTSGTGEVVHVPAQTAGERTIKVNIHARSGAGRYRLFLASPVTSFGEEVELAFDGNVPAGSADDMRAKAVWGHTQRIMMNATDGQYRIRPHALITRDVSCFSCYDAVFSDDNSVSGQCVPGVTTVGIGGWYIALPRPVWDGTPWIDGGMSCGTFSAERAAETMVHEWGHYDFDADDERDGNTPSRNRCGFSLMAGSGKANFTEGNHHYEFCTDALHGKNPAPGATAMGGGSLWDHIRDDYPAMSEPEGTGDFSRMTRLGQMMAAGTFVSFEED